MTAPAPKTLFVIHQIGSGADGGIRSIAEMIRAVPALDKRIVTNIESPVTDRLRGLGPLELWDVDEASYPDRRSALTRRLARLGSRIRNNIRAYRTVRASGVRVLHANDQFAFWNCAIGARLAGAKIVFNVRGAMRPERRSAGQWRRALGLCDSFLVLSSEMEQAWRRDLAPAARNARNRDKFAFIHSIVDRGRYAPVADGERAKLRADLHVQDDWPALVYVGRFDEAKAQLEFIDRTLPALHLLHPGAMTYFVGDFDPGRDPYAAACEEAVRRHGLSEAVRFVGYSARDADWYRAADIVVLASRREGLPRCMIEGIACGSAFVSFDVCSTREIVEAHDCGLVVAQGDYDGLAAACAALLDDPARLARYRANGPKVARRMFDATANGARYLALLADLDRGRRA